ncbi:MAG: transcription antitermination factor NusB [Bacilli bacterium]
MKQVSRSELREKIMTILYQINVYNNNKMSYDVDSVIKENVNIENEFVKEVVYGIITYQKEIDDLANKYLNNWDISRLGNTDQAILRIAIYELVYTKTPSIVCINEAIELAKKYSDDDVRKMINGALDKLYHDKVDNDN